jgi:hypothetical protein
MSKINHDRIREVLDLIAEEQGDRKDARAGRNLPPRYIEHGDPACMVAEIMYRLGISKGVIKALDQEPGNPGGGVVLSESRHPIRMRFTTTAWALLIYLQRKNDVGYTWAEARRMAYTPTSAWSAKYYPGPWANEENVINE